MAQSIIVTRGAPASGKTTWAEAKAATNPQFVNINRDELRRQGVHEGKVASEQYNLAQEALANSKSVIISDTNLSERAMAQWNRLAEEFNAKLKIKDFYESLPTLLSRNAERGEPVPDSAVASMYYQHYINMYQDRNFLVRWWLTSPTWLRSLAILAVGGIAAWIAYKIYRYFVPRSLF